LVDIHHIVENMESAFVVVYCYGDMISSHEGVLFEYHSGSKVITISEDILFDALSDVNLSRSGSFDTGYGGFG